MEMEQEVQQVQDEQEVMMPDDVEQEVVMQEATIQEIVEQEVVREVAAKKKRGNYQSV